MYYRPTVEGGEEMGRTSPGGSLPIGLLLSGEVKAQVAQDTEGSPTVSLHWSPDVPWTLGDVGL